MLSVLLEYCLTVGQSDVPKWDIPSPLTNGARA
jgi:hypothetical protein